MNITYQVLVKEIFNKIAQMIAGATLARCFVVTLLCAMLFLPGSVLAAKGGKGKPGGSGGGEAAAVYHVVMGVKEEADDLWSEDPFWLGEDGGGRRKPINLSSIHDITLDLNLEYFHSEFDEGEFCFDLDSVPLREETTDELTAMSIYKERDESAYVQYWFSGYGKDGKTVIRYVLELFGSASGDFQGDPWRPANSGDTTTVHFASWNMKTNSNKNNNIACTGTMDPGQDFKLTIYVERQ